MTQSKNKINYLKHPVYCDALLFQWKYALGGKKKIATNNYRPAYCRWRDRSSGWWCFVWKGNKTFQLNVYWCLSSRSTKACTPFYWFVMFELLFYFIFCFPRWKVFKLKYSQELTSSSIKSIFSVKWLKNNHNCFLNKRSPGCEKKKIWLWAQVFPQQNKKMMDCT